MYFCLQELRKKPLGHFVSQHQGFTSPLQIFKIGRPKSSFCNARALSINNWNTFPRKMTIVDRKVLQNEFVLFQGQLGTDAQKTHAETYCVGKRSKLS